MKSLPCYHYLDSSTVFLSLRGETKSRVFGKRDAGNPDSSFTNRAERQKTIFLKRKTRIRQGKILESQQREPLLHEVMEEGFPPVQAVRRSALPADHRPAGRAVLVRRNGAVQQWLLVLTGTAVLRIAGRAVLVFGLATGAIAIAPSVVLMCAKSHAGTFLCYHFLEAATLQSSCRSRRRLKPMFGRGDAGDPGSGFTNGQSDKKQFSYTKSKCRRQGHFLRITN